MTWDGDGHDRDTGGAADWSPPERALLDATLNYYGAAEAVIDLSEAPSPKLHVHPAGVRAVRDAMSALEERICAAHDAGVAFERIVGITRLERELVAAIVARGDHGDRGSTPLIS